ncbi:MAG: PQQ-binding-like beta-propeller repeat protein [Anaerolineales bacterium]|nr:PQQ-binding-like beta-propeller repeat protein [Anaerolineales bacterium]MCW5855838.1 PQQ-binding-like beta-propeller repeat protein [Anaerolineales bacterium]
MADRYEIQEIVGMGGMGSVYRARDKNFKAIRLVAIKEMISQVTDSVVRKNIFQIFEREANILATLRHPTIPRIYDYFSVDERAYLVLEFIHGKNLEQLLSDAKGFFPEQQILGWAVELCDVLEYLHAHKPEPVIFRDIKPSNIMCTLQNHIALVDFGIAKVFEGNQKNTMVGTQGYSPPDQYRGEATPQVDIYALGATLHHLLTLRDPQLEAPFSFAERPITEVNPAVSREFAAVVERALEYKPEDRYANAAEMKEALVNVAQKTGTLLNLNIPAVTAPRAQAMGVKPLWAFACEDELRSSPTFHDGILYQGCYDNNLYALDAANGEFSWKYASDGGIASKPAVFEGNVYFGSEDKRLHVVSARSGRVVWTHYTDGPVRSSPRIAEGHAFIGSDDGFLHAVNTASGRLAWKAEAGSPVRSTPFVSSEYVYFGSEAGDFTCVDFRGEARWRFKAKRGVTSSPVADDGVVYFGSMDNTLYALDAGSGWVIWRFRLGKGSISTPALAGHLLYTGAADQNIYCIDVRSAKEMWRFTTEHQVTGSPVLHRGALYCGSVDGSFYCLEAATGQLRWRFQTGGPITATPTVHEDMVFIGSTDKHIYAFSA